MVQPSGSRIKGEFDSLSPDPTVAALIWTGQAGRIAAKIRSHPYGESRE